jgi:uncharacterized membrane protein (DUF485 family)
MSTLRKEEILNSPEFTRLVSRKNTISWFLAVLELVLYFGFIGMIAFNKEYLSEKLGEGSATTIGIPVAVGTIFLSWVLTGVYIYWANNKYDAEVRKIKDRIGG